MKWPPFVLQGRVVKQKSCNTIIMQIRSKISVGQLHFSPSYFAFMYHSHSQLPVIYMQQVSFLVTQKRPLLQSTCNRRPTALTGHQKRACIHFKTSLQIQTSGNNYARASQGIWCNKGKGRMHGSVRFLLTVFCPQVIFLILVMIKNHSFCIYKILFNLLSASLHFVYLILYTMTC